LLRDEFDRSWRIPLETRVETVFPSGTEEKSVALSEEVRFEERVKYIRGTGRLNSRVSVAMEWTESGRVMRADGYTKDIGPKGCLAIVPQNLGAGQKIRLINLVSQVSSEATVIWRGAIGRFLGARFLGHFAVPLGAAIGSATTRFPPPSLAFLPLFPCHLMS
jgi:hypothetical protein